MYHKYKTKDQPLVAYKGGRAVNDTLKKLEIDAIKDQDEKKIDQLLIPRTKKQDQMTYGEEDATQRRQETLESLHDRRDKLYHQLEKLFPPPRIKPVQRGQGSPPIVWYKPRGWIQE